MDIMNIQETANFLRCSISNIRNMVRANKIPFFRIGNRLFFNKGSICTWLHNQEIKNLNNKSLEQNQIRNIKDGAILNVI